MSRSEVKVTWAIMHFCLHDTCREGVPSLEVFGFTCSDFDSGKFGVRVFSVLGVGYCNIYFSSLPAIGLIREAVIEITCNVLKVHSIRMYI